MQVTEAGKTPQVPAETRCRRCASVLIHWPGRGVSTRGTWLSCFHRYFRRILRDLADEVAAAERGGGTVIHVDVMDGHFVPNITIGPPVVKSLRKATKLPLDCHLMIENPDEFIPAFADAGANWVSVHYEACRHLHRSLELIAHHGMKPGVVLNPATRVELIRDILPMVHHVLIMSVNPGFGGQEFIPFSLDKIRRLAQLRTELGAGI